MKTLSFQNFENLVLHSLETEGHTITVKKRNIGTLYNLFKDNSSKLCIVMPKLCDPL